jgi:hypothetical protein
MILAFVCAQPVCSWSEFLPGHAIDPSAPEQVIVWCIATVVMLCAAGPAIRQRRRERAARGLSV